MVLFAGRMGEKGEIHLPSFPNACIVTIVTEEPLTFIRSMGEVINMGHILLIEPNAAVRAAWSSYLTAQGYACRSAATVAEGTRQLSQTEQVLTILNAQLPWRESRAFLRLLEKRGLPVLFLVQDLSNAAHLRAMYASCCQVLQIPATPEQVLQTLQEMTVQAEQILVFGDLTLDAVHRRVFQGKRELFLTTQEFLLLKALMLNPQSPVTREELLQTAWDFQSLGVTRTVDVHIQRLRRKLAPGTIDTVYKTGYQLSDGLRKKEKARETIPVLDTKNLLTPLHYARLQPQM